MDCILKKKKIVLEIQSFFGIFLIPEHKDPYTKNLKPLTHIYAHTQKES